LGRETSVFFNEALEALTRAQPPHNPCATCAYGTSRERVQRPDQIPECRIFLGPARAAAHWVVGHGGCSLGNARCMRARNPGCRKQTGAAHAHICGGAAFVPAWRRGAWRPSHGFHTATSFCAMLVCLSEFLLRLSLCARPRAACCADRLSCVCSWTVGDSQHNATANGNMLPVRLVLQRRCSPFLPGLAGIPPNAPPPVWNCCYSFHGLRPHESSLPRSGVEGAGSLKYARRARRRLSGLGRGKVAPRRRRRAPRSLRASMVPGAQSGRGLRLPQVPADVRHKPSLSPSRRLNSPRHRSQTPTLHGTRPTSISLPRRATLKTPHPRALMPLPLMPLIQPPETGRR